MINSAALLPSLSRSSGLSPRSSIGLNIIRRDSIAVDRLLKERLVLSKVRYGIERQQQERERRRNREADLEADSKQNYEVGDAPNDPRKRRKGIGGLLGTVFGGILSSLGGVAFQAAPAFLLARNNIIKGGTNFNRTIGATDGLLNTIKGQKGPFDTLRKVKLDPVKNIGKTVTKFGNSLTLFVNSAIAGQIGGRAIDRFRTPAQVKAQASQSLKRETTPRTPKKIRKRMKRRSDAKSFAEVQREIDLREYDSLTPKAKARIRSENISRTLREAEEVIPNRKPRVQREDFLGMNKPRKGVQVPVDLLQRQRQRSTRRIVTPVGDEVLRQFNAEQRAIQYGKNFDQIQVNLQDVEFVGDDVFLNRKFSKTPKPALLLETVNIDGKDFYFFNETDSRRLLDERIRKKLEIKDQRRQREITKKYQTQQQKTQQPQGKINRNNFKSAGAMGRQSYPPGFEYELIRPSIFERGRSALSQTADFLSPKNLKGLFKTKSKQFLKPVKEFLGQGIKNIPFIGDLIGILLDVFVFGEPIQRALFLAGGSALGGFLGGLAGAIGGPPGILIGGIIGGIAGDLLGGAFYDLLFRRGQKGSAGQRFGASATKASIKAGLYTGGFAGYGTYMLGEGGREFVLDADSTAALERRSPGFLMALNKARGAEAIGVIEDYASYDKISTGKEKMVPIPIPIPQKESSVQEIIMTDSEAGGGTGGGFITFLSEHYRRG